MINDLIDSIIKRRQAHLEAKIQKYPRSNVVLSDIPDCDRQLVYGVTHWKDKEAWGPEVQARLDAGSEQEKRIVRQLLDMGFKVILSQSPVEIKGRDGQMLARGKIDGFIEHGGTKAPFEIKSMNPNIFHGIKSLEDFQKKPWLRKYVRQLQMYMFGNNVEEGVFICTDCLGHWKLLPVYLDYGECEKILQRMERAAEHIKAKTLPDRILYDSSICEHCGFRLICLADVINMPAELVDNKEFESELDRYMELKPMSQEYQAIHDKIKRSMKDVEKVIVGARYLLQNVPSQTTVYEYPDDIKAQYAVKKPVVRLVIERIEK